MPELFRHFYYLCLLVGPMYLGGYMALSEYRKGSIWAAALVGFLTFALVFMILVLYENARNNEVRFTARLIELARDNAVANWSSEQRLNVKKDRLEREGYSSDEETA